MNSSELQYFKNSGQIFNATIPAKEVPPDFLVNFFEIDRCCYLEVLGMNDKGKELLSAISQANPNLNIITSVKKYLDSNPHKNLQNMFNIDMRATDIYTLGYPKDSWANLDLIHKLLSNYTNNKAVSAVFVFFILATMFKLGLYPLHTIIQNIYQNLSLKYLLFVAGVSSIVYPYFIMKFIVNLFGVEVLLNNEYLNVYLKIFGGIGFIFFNYLALSSINILNFIISLSFAQTSLFAFCISYLNDKSMINGINFSITSHTLIKICLLSILYQIQQNLQIVEIKKTTLSLISNKVYRYLFVVLLFLVSGMPFSLVFMSKWYILVCIFNSATSVLWISIIIIGFAIDIFACFMFIKQILMKKDERMLVVKTDYILTPCIILSILIIIISGFFVGSFKFSL